ncbi:hypothetical protein ICE94_05895 [Polynucleobacter sp. MWH-Loch1C5]|uniref:BPSS1780 family membrane protein n=1 Tax=Polynucleobacter sp. MWH-Loch1C5 TaxID=2689108 RepID=UPI001C0BABB5|nr:BPSS1780 family membrane protein [Polynucleobacter sp. MWH-Loch1C5]MBU3542803.1 hypothetical protein [Polynucleobacter sp. MWH-Loch1C5]
MQLKHAFASDGYVWMRQGFWLFKKNPLAFLMLVFLYIFIAQFAILIPVFGVFIILVLTPGLTVGFMTACQMVIRGERVYPTVYLSGFKTVDPLVRKNLLTLGTIYAFLILILSLIASAFIDFKQLLTILTQQSPPTLRDVESIYFGLGVGLLLYVPIAMIMWFAPLLVAWGKMSVGQALFSSWIACWSNRGAFIYYMIIWAIIIVAMPFFFEALLDGMGMRVAIPFIIPPYSMAALTVLYCSFFATWKACFDPD